jgi:uncharacterized protein YwqG
MRFIPIISLFLLVIGISCQTAPARDVRKLLEPLAKPALVLKLGDSPTRSWFGGRPPRYEGFTWPERKGVPMAFLACLDLAEAKGAGGLEWLPESGNLLFFYDLEGQPWGFDPKDRGGWAVLYVKELPADAPLADLPKGWKEDWEFARRYVKFTKARVPPSFGIESLAKAEPSDADFDALDKWRAEIHGAAKHQVGGWPYPIQDADMDLQAQRASNGLYLGDGSAMSDPRYESLAPGAKDWRLLFQMDSDESLPLMWGDGGLLYYWIKEADAKQGKFSETWVIQQCY